MSMLNIDRFHGLSATVERLEAQQDALRKRFRRIAPGVGTQYSTGPHQRNGVSAEIELTGDNVCIHDMATVGMERVKAVLYGDRETVLRARCNNCGGIVDAWAGKVEEVDNEEARRKQRQGFKELACRAIGPSVEDLQWEFAAVEASLSLLTEQMSLYLTPEEAPKTTVRDQKYFQERIRVLGLELKLRQKKKG